VWHRIEPPTFLARQASEAVVLLGDSCEAHLDDIAPSASAVTIPGSRRGCEPHINQRVQQVEVHIVGVAGTQVIPGGLCLKWKQWKSDEVPLWASRVRLMKQ
jgi:hypothetical protein